MQPRDLQAIFLKKTLNKDDKLLDGSDSFIKITSVSFGTAAPLTVADMDLVRANFLFI